uniref:Sulfide:quinone oxidoreductase, mitochondrial n=1 Tax=Sinonovacula constricta TaxID=98310 RepID=A0A6B9CM12_SINCO|nr:sulfide:quinone oxidoreductase [Sinonovacula constricta]
MYGICVKSSSRALTNNIRREFSTTATKDAKHYPLVIIGGGAGGCSVASRAARALGAGKVAVVEPAKNHYYQPMWTLVGAGIKTVDQSAMPMESILPKQCDLHKYKAVEFDPQNNTVTLSNGEQLAYDYMVVGMGIQINYDKIKGLVEALQQDPMVVSNYNKDYVLKTFPAIKSFKGGNAIFTFPNTPIKCAGAPQKIMYLAEDYWRKHGVRDKVNISYNTSLPVIFGVKKYAARLMEIVKKRNINVNFRQNLVQVDHHNRKAVFQLLDSEKGETETYDYDFLHVSPPMSAPEPLKNSKASMVDAAGFLDVHKETLQHKTFPNIFGIGDCTNVPTSKTAAAVACQNRILFKNLQSVMSGQAPKSLYDGYTSCPLITSYSKCILAEFDFDGQPLETFPFDQGKERRSMYHMKKDCMPQLYWSMMMKGRWAGPKIFRKSMHLGMSR